MSATRFQHTLSRPCQVTGRGYWSSQPITLTFFPAPAGSGIQFVRTDLPDNPRVEAIADNRIDMALRTRLANGSAVVDMIEHVMSALYGLKIDNVEVHCTSCEMPGLDGSSHAYTLALEAAGRTVQTAHRPTYTIAQPLRVGSDSQWVMAFPDPAHSGLSIEYQLDYGPDSSIGRGSFACPVNESTFVHELAQARTFLTLAEAQHLQSKGIAQHVTSRDLLVFGDQGPIDNQLRFLDECPRHKALDLLGDLALVGFDLVGRVVAHRSGHQLNGRLASALREEFFKAAHGTMHNPGLHSQDLHSQPEDKRRIA
ncbi:MAG: UDP-3-O-acyl-N-acetylglucosamine deacetylase [Pirellulaceae bacterium]|nr:UDP-3-O-acyl-N-acetylglucosamine deacetylase [Pirellulaceae bacterium]